MNYDRSQMKQNAKAAMAAANPKTWVVTLVLLLILGGVSGAVGALIPTPLGEFAGGLVEAMMDNRSLDTLLPRDYEELLLGSLGLLGLTAVFSTGATVVLTLLRAVMNYGYYGYCLEVYRREPCAGLGSLFKGFPRFGGAVGGTVLVGVFSFLWGLLIYGLDAAVTVLLLALTGGESAGGWIGAAILLAVAVLIHTLVTYRYCLVPYFLMDGEKMPVTQAITASVETMRGKVGKRFVLELSFLGWELLRGFIALIVTVASSAVAILLTGSSILTLIDLNERGSWMPYETVAAQAAATFMALLVAVVVVFGLTALAQLPLKLWLMSYRNVAYAGFYQELVEKRAAPVPAAASLATGSAYFDNTQPATPVTPFTPPAEREEVPAPVPTVEAVPAAPAPAPYTPFGGSGDVSQAPVEAAPAEPEPPASPEPPAAPAEPED